MAARAAAPVATAGAAAGTADAAVAAVGEVAAVGVAAVEAAGVVVVEAVGAEAAAVSPARPPPDRMDRAVDAGNGSAASAYAVAAHCGSATVSFSSSPRVA
ncbi:hypothetical protein GCM10027262_23320 [Nocardia tengchongensis]